MNTKIHFKSICAKAIAVLMLGLATTILAQAQNSNIESSKTTNHEWIDRPVTINRSGVYKLRENITVQNGDAITITASNVVLDLNGYRIATRTQGTGRGIFINGGSGVVVRNGFVGSFLSNVMVTNAVNITVERLNIIGAGLAPVQGPSEIGIQIVNSRGVVITRNTVTSVNLGIFVRGGNATGNRIFENTLVGGPTPANNLLGVCYNPAPNAGTEGPRGDLIYNNHIARFGYAIAISQGSVSNIFSENTLSSFIGGFREPETLVGNGGTNVAEGNLETTIPATVLP